MGATPHTSVQKGKKVAIKTKEGFYYSGTFVEKKGNYVVVDVKGKRVKLWAGRLKSLTLRKGDSHNER